MMNKDNKIQVQVTIFSEKGYKPISTLVTVASLEEYQQDKSKVHKRGLVQLCSKRYMTQYDLKKYGYTKMRGRVYDKEKIEQENKARYEQIKKERGWT